MIDLYLTFYSQSPTDNIIIIPVWFKSQCDYYGNEFNMAGRYLARYRLVCLFFKGDEVTVSAGVDGGYGGFANALSG